MMEAIVDDMEIPNERAAWIQAAESFSKAVYNRSELEMSRILTLLTRLPFFQTLPFEKRLAIAKVVTFRRVLAGEVLGHSLDAPDDRFAAAPTTNASATAPPATAGTPARGNTPTTPHTAGKPVVLDCAAAPAAAGARGDVVTIVYGRVSLRLQTVTGRWQSMLFKGETFGMPLLSNALPPGSLYVAEETSEVLCIGQRHFADLLAHTDEDEIAARVAFFQRLMVPILASWKPEEFRALAQAVFPLQCQSREVAVKEGDVGDCLFFITHGRFKVVREVDFSMALGQPCVKLLELATLSAGEYFGELALLRHKVDEARKQKFKKITTVEEFDASDGSDDERELRQIDPMIPSRTRQATVFAHTPAAVLVLSRANFIALVTGNALVRMREYVKGYPSEHDVRQHYLKQQRWETFKHEVTLQVNPAGGTSVGRKHGGGKS